MSSCTLSFHFKKSWGGGDYCWMENFHSSCLSLCLTFQTLWAYGVSQSNLMLPATLPHLLWALWVWGAAPRRGEKTQSPETSCSGEQLVALSEDVQKVLLLGSLTFPKAVSKEGEIPVKETRHLAICSGMLLSSMSLQSSGQRAGALFTSPLWDLSVSKTTSTKSSLAFILYLLVRAYFPY